MNATTHTLGFDDASAPGCWTDSTGLTVAPRSPDADLVARLRAGDERAFDQLVRQHAPRMLAVARRFFPCPQDGDDAVQDALVSAFQSIDRFAGTCGLSTWLHRITVNACLMLLRSRRRRGADAAALVGEAASIDELLPRFDATGHHARPVAAWDETFERIATAETQAQVRACIDALPEPYRLVLLLRDIEGLDTQEAADSLGITAGNVKARLHRARQALRALLEPVFGADGRWEAREMAEAAA